MKLPGLDRETIVANVLDARGRKRRALAEYEAASAELAWWLQGAKLAGINEMQIDEDDENLVPDDLFPPTRYFLETGEHPTLRQAIMAELQDNPSIVLPVAELAARLVERGWLDDANAHKRVSDLAGLMHKEEQLQRVSRGVYKLHPRFAARFDQTADVRILAELPSPGSWPPASM